MYNLCRLSKQRIQEAAFSGLVPHLQYFIRIDSPLKQFALPIICDMAHSKQARKELWKYEGVQFFLELLQTKFGSWQANAMDALSVW